MDTPLKLSVIVPTLNEAAFIVETIQVIRQTNAPAEIIVVDGGSTDATVELAKKQGVTVLRAPQRGRGAQLGFGAAQARGNVLWFLHADTRPTKDVRDLIQAALVSPDAVGGNFRLVFDGDSGAARFLTRLYPHLRLLGLSYGDAGMFVRSDAYEKSGGFRSHPLFEDLDLLRRLRRLGKLIRLETPVVTSSRRFEGRNFSLIFAGWTGLQILFWFGVPPRLLVRLYAPIRSGKTKKKPTLIPAPSSAQSTPEEKTPSGI